MELVRIAAAPKTRDGLAYLECKSVALRNSLRELGNLAMASLRYSV